MFSGPAVGAVLGTYSSGLASSLSVFIVTLIKQRVPFNGYSLSTHLPPSSSSYWSTRLPVLFFFVIIIYPRQDLDQPNPFFSAPDTPILFAILKCPDVICEHEQRYPFKNTCLAFCIWWSSNGDRSIKSYQVIPGS